MSDKIITDSIDLVVTKQDFIELMDDNAKQLDEIERYREALERRTALLQWYLDNWPTMGTRVAEFGNMVEAEMSTALNGEQGG
jgi:hypothetical protein